MNQKFVRMLGGALVALTGAAAAGGASLIGAAPASAAAVTVTGFAAATQPTISAGQTSAAAGNWTFKIPNTFNGDEIQIQITIPGALASQTCSTANDFIEFAGTPGGSVVSDPSNTGTNDTVPRIVSSTPVTSETANCHNLGITDLLLLDITNTATGPIGDMWDVTITGVTYDVGSATAPGPVPVGTNVGAPVAVYNTTEGAGSNATVSAVNVSANNPAVSVPAGAGQSISNVTLTELQAKAISSGGATDEFVCLTLSNGSWTTPSGTVNVVTASNQTGASTVSNVSAAANVLSFQATPAGTPTATTFTVSAASVTAANPPGPVTLTVTNAPTASCAAAHTLASGVTAYGVTPASSRVFGQTADGTAAAQFLQSFNCPGIVILAQDGFYSDALAASFLAGELDTGILLTNPSALSPEAANAISQNGISNVVIVGGPNAVLPAVANTLTSTPVSKTCNSSASGNITVERLFGQTADDTAAAIATACATASVPGCNSSAPGSRNLSAVYASNPYNDTAGTGSSAAVSGGSLTTAIVASDAGFQDADAAGALAFDEGFPVLTTNPGTLSPQVSTALQNLGIKQVILMGGQDAVSDGVTTAIQALGISVIRVAGTDYTDTAQLLAQFELSATSDAGFSWNDGGNVCVVRGDFFADSLGAGPYCGNFGPIPVLFTLNTTTAGAFTDGFLGAQGLLHQLSNLVLSGGVLALTPGVLTEMQDAVAQG